MSAVLLPRPSERVQASPRDYVFEAPNYNAALPAAGAWTDQDFQPIPPLARRLSAIATYTGGAGSTGGKPKFRIQWCLDGAVPIEEVILDTQTQTVSAPTLTLSEYEFVITGITSAANVALTHRVVSLEIPSGVQGVRVIAAEVGDTTHPGTLKMQLATSDTL